MDSIELKKNQLNDALETLHKSLETYAFVAKNTSVKLPQSDHDETRLICRDSTIQRFEYCAELFWKYLKKYMETKSAPIEYNAPVPVVRAAFSIGLLREQEAEDILEMIKDRNKTSHIYKEEIAEYLSVHIPHYYQLMHDIVEKLK